MKFRQETLGEFKVDEEFEFFVKAWTAYHEAADRVDGGFPFAYPFRSKFTHLAVKAGREAMAQIIHRDEVSRIMRRTDPVRYKKWQSAKLEALRRMGK